MYIYVHTIYNSFQYIIKGRDLRSYNTFSLK